MHFLLQIVIFCRNAGGRRKKVMRTWKYKKV